MSQASSTGSGNIDRRSFIKRAGIGAAALSLAGGARGTRVLGANDRINIGAIGVGGRGGGLCRKLIDRSNDPENNWQVIGVCDVWDGRTQRHVDHSKGTAKGFRDYRELLRMPGLDAVVIGTPDHWHSTISIAAMRAGMDVYCEKPMTLYWRQAKKVAQVARKTGAVFQCGSQSASDGKWWTARDIVAQGGIGPLVWTQGGAFRNNPSGDWNWGIQGADPNTDLDWDMWLGWKWGLAPKRPYDRERYSRFRKYWDYSGGLATDLLYHTWAHLMIGIGPQFPVAVTAGGANPVHTLENDNREVPTVFHIIATFAGSTPLASSQHTAHLIGTQENRTGEPDMIRGQKATLETDGGEVKIVPEQPFRDEMMELAHTLECYEGAKLVTEGTGDKEKLQEIRVPNRYDWGDHMDNWLRCLRTREEPTLNADRAYQVMVPIALSVIAYRQGRVVYFDPQTERAVDSMPKLEA
ncbi:MAG: Gfo/Idh/MocA family oxidoreductase [Armatimonadota bacterium]